MTDATPNFVGLIDSANVLIASNNSLVRQLAASGIDTPAAHEAVLEAYDAHDFARTHITGIIKSVIAEMALDDEASPDAIAGAATMLDLLEARDAYTPTKEEYLEKYRQAAQANKRDQ